jgi:hypothetical protein
MNQKSSIVILAVIIVILAGTAIYFATSQKIASPTINQPNGEQGTVNKPGDNATTTPQAPATEDETSIEDAKWENAPAEIKELYTKNDTTYLSIDILSKNPNFNPGVTDFFINQSDKLREVKIDNDTKFYKCGLGPDNIDTTADISSSTNDLLARIQQKLAEKDLPLIYYFDITGGAVGNIYEQCLP